MNRLASCLTTALLVLASLPAIAGGDPARNGALATPANRIIGLWTNTAQVGPCGGPAIAELHQTLLFGPGGTMIDNSPFPPQGAPAFGIPGTNQRSIGLGTWRYNPLTARYTSDHRFDWFVNNVYHGYQVVHRTILLSNDGNRASGPVRTARYTADGTRIFELCGTATATRL